MMKTRLFTVCYALLLSAACALAEDYTRYYTDLPVDVKQVTGPQIPDRSVCLTDFGAVGNGLTLCTDAFARAIAALESQGGGRLVVPEGVWLTGPIELKSNIDLHLEQNALIYFSPDKRLYTGHLDSRGRCMPCISADGCHDIAITGKGTIDGGGSNDTWWPWVGSKKFGFKDGMPVHQWNENSRPRLLKQAEDGVPMDERRFGPTDGLRPQMINFNLPPKA